MGKPALKPPLLAAASPAVAPPKRPAGYRKLASEEERIEAWVVARLVGVSQAARSLAVSRETLRQVVLTIEADDAQRALALARWATVAGQIQARTSELYAALVARAHAIVADPHQDLTLPQLIDALTALGPLCGLGAPAAGGKGGKGAGPVLAVPAFLLRDRPETPDAPTGAPDDAT